MLDISMPGDVNVPKYSTALEGSPTSVANGFNIFSEPLRAPMTPQNTASRLSFSLENSPEAYKGTNVIGSSSQPQSLSLNSVDPLLLQKARLTESEIVSLMNDDFSSAEHELLLSIPE